MFTNTKNVRSEISGKPAAVSYGIVAPATFGKTSLSLTDNRVIESTKRIIASRYCEIILSEVESVEINEGGYPALLALGFLTIGFGVGLIFLVMYFLIKCKYLIVRSHGNVQVVCISGTGSMERAREFMIDVLRYAEEAKQK